MEEWTPPVDAVLSSEYEGGNNTEWTPPTDAIASTEYYGEKEEEVEVEAKKTSKEILDDKKKKRIALLENRVKDWKPDETISYDQLPMMDIKAALYSDYKELQRLKGEISGERVYGGNQSDISKGREMMKDINAQKIDYSLEDTRTYRDDLGIERKYSELSEGNEMSFKEFEITEGNEDKIISLVKTKYPNIKVEEVYDNDDALEITTAAGSTVINFSKSDPIDAYNDIIKAVRADEKAVIEKPIIKEVQEASFGRLQVDEDGLLPIYFNDTETMYDAEAEFFDLMGNVLPGMPELFRQPNAEDGLELINEIKRLGADAYGNPNDYLGSNFTKDELAKKIEFTPEEEQKIAEQILSRIQGATYKDVNGEMVLVSQKDNKFTGLTGSSFHDIYDIAGIKDLRRTKGLEILANNYAIKRGDENRNGSEEGVNTNKQQNYDALPPMLKKKADLELQLREVVKNIEVDRNRLLSISDTTSTEYKSVAAQYDKNVKLAEQLEIDIKKNAEYTVHVPDTPDWASVLIGVPLSGTPNADIKKIDPVAASRFYSGTTLSLEKLEELRTTTETVEKEGLEEIKKNMLGDAPTMSPLDLAEAKYELAVGDMEYNRKIGQENFLEFKLRGQRSLVDEKILKSRLIDAGIISAEYRNYWPKSMPNSIKLSFTQLSELGYEVEDFEGWLDEKAMRTNLVGDSKNKVRHFKSWFEDHIESKATARGLYNLAYLNTDLSKMTRESSIITGFKSAFQAAGKQWFDFSGEDIKKYGLATDIQKQGEWQESITKFNELKEVKSGEIAPLVLNKEQVKALETTLAEDVAMGVGEFVPMLVELGVVSYATGGMGGLAMLSKLKWFKNAPKLLQHAIAATVEEAKMEVIFDMPATGGAMFYTFGTATNNLVFNKRFKFLKPLFDKVIKNGPVGATSMELASISEAAYDELMGNADFSAEMDELYGDADETTKRIIVNSIVFGLTGIHHVKKTDFYTTQQKLKAQKVAESNLRGVQRDAFVRTQKGKQKEKEQQEYLEGKTEDKVISVDAEGRTIKGNYVFEGEKLETTEEGGGKPTKEKPVLDPTPDPGTVTRDVPEGYRLEEGVTIDGVSYGDRYVSLDGKKPTKEIGATIEDYQKKYPKDKEIIYTDKEKSKIKSYSNTRNTMNQLFLNDVYAWNLNPDNPKFETNFQKQFMEPMNQVIKSIDSNAKNIEISFGKGSIWRKQNIKNGENSTAEFQPDWVNSKGEKVGRVVMDISEYTSGKQIHEITHAVADAYFKANPIAKANFGRKLVGMFENYNFGENPVFEGTTGEDLKKRIDEVYSELNEEKRTEEFIAFVAEILGNPEVYYSHPNLAGSLLKEIKLEVKDILGEVGLRSFTPKNAADAVELLGLLGKGYRTGTSIKRKGKAYAELLGVDILGSQNILAKNNAEAAKSKAEGEVMSSKDLYDNTSRQDNRNEKIEKIYKEHAEGKTKAEWDKWVNTDKGRAEIWSIAQSFRKDIENISKGRGDESPVDVASETVLLLVDQHIPAFNPEVKQYQGKFGLGGYIGRFLKLKTGTAAEGTEKQIDDISLEQPGVKYVAEKQVDRSTSKKPASKEKVDRQISTFEGKEAKAKEQEILDIFNKVEVDKETGKITNVKSKLTKAELEKRSKKGIAGTPKEEVAQVAELLFDAPGEKLVGPSKNLSFETPIVHNKLEHNGKKILDKKGKPIKLGDIITPKQIKDHPGLTGIKRESDFSKVRDYFKDVSNVERFVKTLGKYSFIPNQVRINEQGEKIDISKEVLGRGLGLPKRFVDYFFETLKDPKGEFLTPSGRTKGGKVQLQPGQAKILKSKFINPSKETIKEIQEDLLVGKDIKEYDRGEEGVGQLAKGFAVVESMKVSSEATRKGLPTETKEQKQLYANLKAGANDIMSSMDLTAKMRKVVYDMLNDLEKSRFLSLQNITDFIKSDKYKSIPVKIKDFVTQFFGKNFREFDSAAAEIATIEKIAKDLSKIWGITITPEQVRKIELKGATTWKEISKELGITNMNRAMTSSKEYAERKKAHDIAFVKYMIPEGKEFKDLSTHQQTTIAKTIGEGDVRSSAKSGVGERPTTKKEYAKELREKLKKEGRDWKTQQAVNNPAPKEATIADLLEVVYGKDILKGSGPKSVEGSEASFAPANWGTFRHSVEKFLDKNPSIREIKEFVRNLLTGKDFGYDATMSANVEMLKRTYGSQVERFVDNSYVYGKDRVEVNFGSKEEAIKFIDKAEKLGLVGETHWKNASGENVGFDFRKVVFRSEINALERAGTKELFLDKLGLRDRSQRALEDVAGMLQQQVNRATGAFKTYVPLRSVARTPGEVWKIFRGKRAGRLHNEHETELLTMNRKFVDALKDFKEGNLSAEQLRKYVDHMVERLNQSTIQEAKRVQKDATGNAVADYVNKLLYLGEGAKDQIHLSETSTLVNMSEVMANELGRNEIGKLKNTVWDKLSTLGALVKQKTLNVSSEKAVKKSNLELTKEARVSSSKDLTTSQQLEKLRNRDKAMRLAGLKDKPVKKARVFDFDDTVGRTNSKVYSKNPLFPNIKISFNMGKPSPRTLRAIKEGKVRVLTAEEFARDGQRLEAEGWKMDFSDFNRIVDGKKGPLFDVMKKMKEAAGERDMFILTARSPESAKAIQRFLKEMGVDIPLENIKGLGDSSPYAKSDWILEKAAEGYNDFYFADDHAPNVKAVRDVLEQIDVKSKVQRALSSKNLNKEFNRILEEKSGIEHYKEYSKSKGKVVGAKKGKYKFFLPPGAEDFTGLIYPTLGKGKKGEAQLEWYNDNLIKPYNRATRNLSTDKVQLMNDFKGLKKQLDMPKDLREITKSGYTKEQAARVYLWDKMGEKVPNLSKADFKELIDIVNNDGKLKAFADQILEATKGDGYSTPGKEWLSGTMTTDLIDVLNVNKRKKYLEEWQQNIDIIYSEKNLNKLEAIYGSKYREALENSIKRMKTGKNRTSTGNRASDALLDYINGAQGTIMFLNMRSAVLQSISAANFVNLSFNNPIKAGKAFLNQKQYWKDFMEIMNSDYLVGRRQGLKLNISESEIADAAAGSTNKAKAVINYILEKGYAPTKFMDSFAIASGGATWYRNKIKDLVKKEGLSEAEAQKKAFEEFMEISEKSQQSSDPSKISAQQASDMGRVFLQFVNTPMQYVRIQKRAAQDLANKRGDWKSNISKILYYGVIQNIWFNAMQQGLFALGFGDDEINEKEEKKIVDTANGMADSILRGSGFVGMTLSVLKNTVIDLYRRSGRQRPKYGDAWMKLLEFSPAVKSKFGKLKSAAWPFDTKKGRKEIVEKGFSLDNPAFESGAKVISAATNIPLDRLFLKYNNLKAMMSEETETWKDIALFLGWPEYQLEEGGTVTEDKIRNMMDDTKKDEQKQMLLDLGYTIREVSWFRKEEDRVKAIISGQNGVKLKPPPSRKPKED